MIKIFPTIQIKELDAYTIENEPIASIDLMERASQALAKAISERWGAETPFTVFAGPGNNGGDALAVSRLLAEQGYRVEVYLFNTKGTLSPDCETNKERLARVSGIDFHEITTQFVPPVLTAEHVVVDGLFGSGLNKPLSGGFAAVVKYINSSPATVVAIDVPSGLMGEDNTYNIQANIIRADLTLSLQLPKLAFLFAENEPFVGEWQLLDIGLSEEAITEKETDFALTEHEDMASVLAARACLRSGVGLLTVHIPFCNNFIVQTAVPEAMTEIDINDVRFSCATDTDDYQAVGIGPGLGRAEDTEAALLDQIDSCQTPMIVDADALNLLGEHRSYIGRLPKGSILTPHPKELERLVGKCQNSYERLTKARELAKSAGVYIILKGAYSVIIAPSGKCWFNPTGNPGMATGGSGDVLTGVVLALLAQGYDAETAARMAAYVHGLAGDIACKKHGAMGMTAGDIVTCLPLAWRMLEEKL